MNTVLILLLLCYLAHSQDLYEEEYYYYYGEEDEALQEYEVKISSFEEEPVFKEEEEVEKEEDSLGIHEYVVEEEFEYVAPAPAAKYGFKQNMGGGIKKITAPIINKKIVEDLSSQFGCFLNKNSGPQKVIDYTIRVSSGKDAAQNKTAVASPPGKRLTARDIEAQRLKAKEEEEKRMKIKFPLGADCEAQICGACKVIVEEFGTIEAVYKLIFSFLSLFSFFTFILKTLLLLYGFRYGSISGDSGSTLCVHLRCGGYILCANYCQ